MSAFMDVNIWMIVGFLLAAYSVVANDSLQTLGTYISSNKKRTPKVVQMLFICTVTIVVLMMGWFLKDGDPAWGRLSVPGKEFPLPESLGCRSTGGLQRSNSPAPYATRQGPESAPSPRRKDASPALPTCIRIPQRFDRSLRRRCSRCCCRQYPSEL